MSLPFLFGLLEWCHNDRYSNALCPVRPPQTAIGRTAGTLLGSAPVPVAIFGVVPAQSARGLAHSRTLRAVRGSAVNAPASWSAVALHRFSIAHQTRTQIQFNIASFVQPSTAFGRVLADGSQGCRAKGAKGAKENTSEEFFFFFAAFVSFVRHTDGAWYVGG